MAGWKNKAYPQRLIEGRQYCGRNGLGFQPGRNIVNEDRELVAVEPGQCGRIRNDARDAARDFRQKPVADPVSKGMIDGAEMIQIEHRNGNRAAVALGVGDRFGESVLESLPIRQAGERIGFPQSSGRVEHAQGRRARFCPDNSTI